jgi:hypothetical protein
MTLESSVAQPAVQAMTATGYAMESGYVPGVRFLCGASTYSPISVGAGWNLVSVPLTVGDYRKTVLFPTATSPAFYFQNGYQQRDTLRNGEGYWLKFSTGQTVGMSGTTIPEDTVDVRAGWNIIGNISYPILASSVTPVPTISILSSFYGFVTGTGYTPADTLKPGCGYWVKVSGAGQLVMKCGSLLAHDYACRAPQLKEQDAINSIVVKDAEGKERTLYYSSERSDLDLQRYELPPPPPEGVMDVRFASQRSVEAAKATDGRTEEFPIRMTGTKYPLEFRWKAGADRGESVLEVTYAGEESQRYKLSDEGSIVLTKSNVLSVKLLMTAKRTVELPKEFALHQNYPNPFNPSTVIRYDLPAAAQVRIAVFNLLGQQVTTLADEVQDAGFKSIEWRLTDGAANSVASGVYFYRIEASAVGNPTSSFSAVRKMMVLK